MPISLPHLSRLRERVREGRIITPKVSAVYVNRSWFPWQKTEWLDEVERVGARGADKVGLVGFGGYKSGDPDPERGA